MAHFDIRKPQRRRVKFENNKEYECLNFSFEQGDSFNIFGGEAWLDHDIFIDEYGIECDNMSIFNIPSVEFKKLALEMVNHLINNGHQFYLDEINGEIALKEYTIPSPLQIREKIKNLAEYLKQNETPEEFSARMNNI